MSKPDIEAEEVNRITELIRQKYGYDFSNYASSSFKRRLLRILDIKHLSVNGLMERLVQQPSFVDEFLDELTVNVTEMFRDKGFWNTLRNTVIPALRTSHPQFKIWHAGCSSGEEVFSMAIVLREMGISEDVAIVATDLDDHILEKARSGTYPLKNMELNEKNYTLFQGKPSSLAPYYSEENKFAVFDRELIRNVSFLRHDLVTGEVFNKFNLILCRNVMIYFNQALQNEVLKKFHRSLETHGYLAMGSNESLVWCDIAGKFNAVNSDEKIYKKIKD